MGVFWRCAFAGRRRQLKTAVVSDRYEPIFQRTTEQYASIEALSSTGQSRAIRRASRSSREACSTFERAFSRGEQWLDLAHVQREARRWCIGSRGPAYSRNHPKSPLVVFEQVELACLRPVKGPRFDTPQWATPTVHDDHHVKFLKAYSVPTHYVGKQVTVRGDKALVRIYYKNELIKTHPRKPAGGRATDYTDYPPELEAYARRDPERMVRQAKKLGNNIGRFMSLLLSGVFPWAKLRQAQKLMRLADKYGHARVETACQRALGFDLINVRVERILKNAIAPSDEPPQTGELVSMPLRFLRPNESFSHEPKRKENKMEIKNSLKTILKRLKLSILATLPRGSLRSKEQNCRVKTSWNLSCRTKSTDASKSICNGVSTRDRGVNLREFRLGAPDGLRSPSRSRALLAQFSRGSSRTFSSWEAWASAKPSSLLL